MKCQGDSLHEVSKLIFWKKIRKIFQNVSAEIFIQCPKLSCCRRQMRDFTFKTVFSIPKQLVLK